MIKRDLLALSGLLHIVHHIPGRLRLRVSNEAFRRLPGLSLADIRRLVDKIEGVRTLRIAPATLSAVIEYDHQVISPSLWHNLIDGPEDSARQAYTTLTGRIGPVQEPGSNQ